MDDAGRMCGHQGGGHLNRDVERLGDREALFPQALPQRLTIDEFSADKVRVLKLADLIDGNDVGMIEGRRRVRLLLKAAHPFPVLGYVCEQELEGYLAAQPLVLRQVYFAHAARAQMGKYLVLTDALSHNQGHAWRASAKV